MDMTTFDFGDGSSIWLFDYPTDLLVQAFRDEEVRAFVSENNDEKWLMVKPLRRVADLMAKQIKKDFDCDCEAVQVVVVPKPGESLVVRMSVNLSYMAQGFPFDLIKPYVEALLADLKSGCDHDSEYLESGKGRINKKIKSALKQCASGQESVIIPLDLSSGDSVEITIPPKPPVVNKVPERFTGQVWCVNDKAKKCRVQVKSLNGKERNLLLNFKSYSRNLLLESQLREVNLRFEIEPYDQKNGLHGEIMSVVVDAPELDL